MNALQRLRAIQDRIEKCVEDRLIPMMSEHSDYRQQRAQELKDQQHPNCMEQSLIDADEKYPNEGAAHTWVTKLAASGICFLRLKMAKEEGRFDAVKDSFLLYTESMLQSGNTSPISAEAARNRKLLIGVMTVAGWDFYQNEWWHYQLFNPRAYRLWSDKEAGTGLM